MADNKKLHFPKEFLWGASVSTHQVEGRNHNQWSVWELETAKVKAAQAQYKFGHLPVWPEIEKEANNPQNYVSGRAADHFNRYEHDFALAKQLHLNAMRSGIEWSRIEPEEGQFSSSAIEHYKKYFAKMRKEGITPVITLWHWTMPIWFSEMGGFEKHGNIKYFARYVEKICQELGDHLNYVITINEPTVYAGASYFDGNWPPQETSFMKLQRVSLNLALAHRKAYKIVKAHQPKARVGLAHNCTYYYSGDSTHATKLAVWLDRWVGNYYFINLVKKRQDFVGLNYYFASRLTSRHFKKKESHNAVWKSHPAKLLRRVIDNPNEKISDTGFDMQPDKIGLVANELYKKYKKPVLITESGLADRADINRKWWIAESIKSLDGAIKDGTKILGYIHWSLLDNFEWAEGFWPRFGLIKVNYKTQQRKVRESAKFYAQLIKKLRQ